MNVQNIPSKHSDIRHMFRGQPAHDITLSCKAENNTVTITLFKFSKVKKQLADSQIEMTETCELQINDSVVLKHNGQDTVLSIADIHRHEDNPDMYTLSFAAESGSNWAVDIETATSVLISSDYSQQEPKLTAVISNDPNMIKSFQEDKDIYSFIASLAFNTTYEACLENLPTGEYDEDGNEIKVYQPDGKARRSSAKTIVLGRLSSYAPSAETLVHRLLNVNLVNCMTRRCAARCMQ